MPVVARHQVSSHFVLQQGVYTPAWNAGSTADQQLVTRNHKAGKHVIPNGNLGGKIRAALLVIPQLILRSLREFGGRELASPGTFAASRRNAIEKFFRLAQQWVGDTAEDLQALLQESRRIDVAQQRDLTVEFILLLAEQKRQSRVFDALNRDGIELAFQQNRVDRKRPVIKQWRFVEARAAKVPPRTLGIDRRSLQQQVKKPINFGKLAIDIDHGSHDGASAGCLKLSGPQHLSLVCEREVRLLQREVKVAAHGVHHGRVDLPRRLVPVERTDHNTKHKTVAVAAFSQTQKRLQTGRRQTAVRAQYDMCPAERQDFAPKRFTQGLDACARNSHRRRNNLERRRRAICRAIPILQFIDASDAVPRSRPNLHE